VSDGAASERIDSVLADLDEVRSAIQQPDPFSFTLAGTESSIPLRIENRGPTPLRIVVRADAEQLRFPDDEIIAVLDPNATTDVFVPVVARSNGVFPVQIELLTPAGSSLFEPISLTARVNSLTGLGRVVTVGAVLVLATWWFSDIRRRRRRRRDDERTAAQLRHPAGVADLDDVDQPPDADFATDRSPDAEEATVARRHHEPAAGIDHSGDDSSTPPRTPDRRTHSDSTRPNRDRSSRP
jgi:hypothetical protein